jgi:hypothetical protein
MIQIALLFQSTSKVRTQADPLAVEQYLTKYPGIEAPVYSNGLRGASTLVFFDIMAHR